MQKNYIVPTIIRNIQAHNTQPIMIHSQLKAQLKGKSIDYCNQQLINIQKQNNITDYVLFDISMLQTFVEKEKKFSKGLIQYLKPLLCLYLIGSQVSLRS
jgi:hypothetical protein